MFMLLSFHGSDLKLKLFLDFYEGARLSLHFSYCFTWSGTRINFDTAQDLFFPICFDDYFTNLNRKSLQTKIEQSVILKRKFIEHEDFEFAF